MKIEIDTQISAQLNIRKYFEIKKKSQEKEGSIRFLPLFTFSMSAFVPSIFFVTSLMHYCTFMYSLCAAVKAFKS